MYEIVDIYNRNCTTSSPRSTLLCTRRPCSSTAAARVSNTLQCGTCSSSMATPRVNGPSKGKIFFTWWEHAMKVKMKEDEITSFFLMNSGYQHDHHDNKGGPRICHDHYTVVDIHLENKPYLRNPAALVSPWKDPSTPTLPTTRPLRRCCRQIRHGSPFLPEHQGGRQEGMVTVIPVKKRGKTAHSSGVTLIYNYIRINNHFSRTKKNNCGNFWKIISPTQVAEINWDWVKPRLNSWK